MHKQSPVIYIYLRTQMPIYSARPTLALFSVSLSVFLFPLCLDFFLFSFIQRLAISLALPRATNVNTPRASARAYSFQTRNKRSGDARPGKGEREEEEKVWNHTDEIIY